VAWTVDPALALSLQDHFPSNADVKHALEQLVVESAHEAKVRDSGSAAYCTIKCCCCLVIHEHLDCRMTRMCVLGWSSGADAA
jgi:hypothetical protein